MVRSGWCMPIPVSSVSRKAAPVRLRRASRSRSDRWSTRWVSSMAMTVDARTAGATRSRGSPSAVRRTPSWRAKRRKAAPGCADARSASTETTGVPVSSRMRMAFRRSSDRPLPWTPTMLTVLCARAAATARSNSAPNANTSSPSLLVRASDSDALRMRLSYQSPGVLDAERPSFSGPSVACPRRVRHRLHLTRSRASARRDTPPSPPAGADGGVGLSAPTTRGAFSCPRCARPLRIVGAICVVSTGAPIRWACFAPGVETRMGTLRSSALAPPCSAIFDVPPV